MRSLLLIGLLASSSLLAGCLQPQHDCPAPIEECEYGYIDSEASTGFYGFWNSTSVEEAVEDHEFSVSSTFPYTRIDEENPGYLKDGSSSFQIFAGVSVYESDRDMIIWIFVDRWVGEDRAYNITVNVSYTVENELVHYLPLESAEAERDEHLVIVKPWHGEFVRYLEKRLGWEVQGETGWKSTIDEKPDYIRESEAK